MMVGFDALVVRPIVPLFSLLIVGKKWTDVGRVKGGKFSTNNYF